MNKKRRMNLAHIQKANAQMTKKELEHTKGGKVHPMFAEVCFMFCQIGETFAELAYFGS